MRSLLSPISKTAVILSRSEIVIARSNAVREIHASGCASLPRSRGHQRSHNVDDSTFKHSSEREDSLQQPDSSSSSAVRTDDLPWFLQDSGTIEVTRPTPPRQTIPQASEPLRQVEEHHLPPGLPNSLRMLHSHITLGPAAGLLHQPSFLDADSEGQGSSSTTADESISSRIKFIPARLLGGSSSWCDWIVVITVRENHGGQTNARVAEEVAEVLRRTGPPSLHESDRVPSALDDLLGPGASSSTPSDLLFDSNGSSSKQASLHAGQVDGSDSASPARRPPAWALHREALREKFASSDLGTASWRPNKILSRETQSGLRLLHATDPDKWTVPALSSQFKVSPESIRRILRANPERWGGDSKEAGHGTNRNGVPERWLKEEEEIERLRGLIARDQEDSAEADESKPTSEQVSFPNSTGDDSRPSQPFSLRSLGKPRHPVRLEGLPATSSSATRRRAARGKSSAKDLDGLDGGSSGEWVLVDAGWCVVHVMTPKARSRYDVEGMWETGGKGGGALDDAAL